MNKLFIEAIREKYRYSTDVRQGMTTEDLWDLPLIGKTLSLDMVYKYFNKQLQGLPEESIIQVNKSISDELIKNKFNIIKYIIEVKLAERDKHAKAAENKVLRDKLLSIKAQKQEAALLDMDEAELDKKLAELE